MFLKALPLLLLLTSVAHAETAFNPADYCHTPGAPKRLKKYSANTFFTRRQHIGYRRIQIAPPISPQYERISNSTPLKLLGRGMQSKKTGESFALACVGAPDTEGSLEPSCNILKFIYVPSTLRKAYFLTGEIYPSGSPSKPVDNFMIFITIDALLKSFKQVAVYGQSDFAQAVRCEGGTVLMQYYPPQTFQNYFGKAAKLSFQGQTSLTNKDGWNWSEDPQVIDHDAFDVMLKIITHWKTYAPQTFTEEKTFADTIYAIRE